KKSLQAAQVVSRLAGSMGLACCAAATVGRRQHRSAASAPRIGWACKVTSAAPACLVGGGGRVSVRPSVRSVSPDVVEPPLHQLGAAKAHAHGPVHGLLLVQALVEHEKRKKGSADAVAADAVNQNQAVAGVPQN